MFEQLLSTVIGGALAIGGGAFVQWRSNRREARSVAQAFAGEIGAIIAIIEYRGYEKVLKECLEATKTTRQSHPFVLDVKYKYTNVYESNTVKLGLLPPLLAGEVARFYTFTFSLLEDAGNPRLAQLSADDLIQYLEQESRMLRDLIELGKALVPQLEKA